MVFIYCNTMRATSPKILYEVDLLKKQSHRRKEVFSKGTVCESLHFCMCVEFVNSFLVLENYPSTCSF
jgi:hypothetical protein